MAFPLWVPSCQASTIAGTLAAAQFSTKGRPFISTKTIFELTAATRSKSSCWNPGRSKFARDRASPD